MMNFRYEMSDDELSQCGSGLEGLIEDEIIEEAKTSEGSDSESTDASETNAIENGKRKITGTEDEEDFSNDIDDESSNSDLDLNDVIQSEDDEDNSSEDRNEVLEEGINYSELEEEDYDSEAFSFTGTSNNTLNTVLSGFLLCTQNILHKRRLEFKF